LIQIIILRDVGWKELRAIVTYMYKGEINVDHDELPDILRAAEALRIRGLVDFASANGGDTRDQVRTVGNKKLKSRYKLVTSSPPRSK
jgi:hypothetical protein